MRMLHIGLRVTDLERSRAFYSALGYAELGGVPETQFGSLTMLQLPDDPFVSHLDRDYRGRGTSPGPVGSHDRADRALQRVGVGGDAFEGSAQPSAADRPRGHHRVRSAVGPARLARR